VEGIVLMTIMVLFLIELMAMRYGNFGHSHEHEHEHEHGHGHGQEEAASHDLRSVSPNPADELLSEGQKSATPPPVQPPTSHAPGDDHLGHVRAHVANSELNLDWEERGSIPESYAAQMTAIFILEFGVIFHSIFIGLTLAVSGSEFNTLYIVLAFHQTFEGLGLGSRLASVPWPTSKRWTPYILAVSYGVSTPIAIAIGLAVRNSFAPGSERTLIVNGIFDSISAGILIYTGLVELMAHEFMFSPSMQRAPLKVILSALALMWMGAGLMALLGKWA
jgi:solute carrier family 39 (zinc transporter), member 1/2/3